LRRRMGSMHAGVRDIPNAQSNATDVCVHLLLLTREHTRARSPSSALCVGRRLQSQELLRNIIEHTRVRSPSSAVCVRRHFLVHMLFISIGEHTRVRSPSSALCARRHMLIQEIFLFIREHTQGGQGVPWKEGDMVWFHCP
ncbi:unnamed protein product, partial [Lampetra planeri]